MTGLLWKIRGAKYLSLKEKEKSFLRHMYVKFIYSEKATKFCEISTVDLTVTTFIGQIYGGDFAKFCGLLRIYEL